MMSCNSKKEISNENSSNFHIAVLPIKECRPFVFAKENGIFDSLGVKVELLEFNAAMDADTAFLKGWAQMEVTDSVKYNYMRSDSDTIVKVISDSLTLSLVAHPNAKIKEVKDIKEKIIAVARNSSLILFTNKLAEKAGINPIDINIPKINNIDIRTNMLIKEQYDGAILPEPWATRCTDIGAIRVMTNTEFSKDLLSVIVTKTTKANRNEEIEKVIQGYNIAKQRIEKEK